MSNENDSPIMDSNPLALVVSAQAQGLVNWSESKKKEFVGTFNDRTDAAKFILEMTAKLIFKKAGNRKFLSQKHANSLNRSYNENFNLNDYYFSKNRLIGGRTAKELYDIADERAEVILKELPPLKKVVEIIDPDTAKTIRRRDELLEKGQTLTEKLEEVSVDIKMSDLDQKMTIGQFRTLVKERDKTCTKIVEQLDEIGTEGSELEEKINKALYSGIPGLSEAVIKVIVSHLDRAKALDQVKRRVGEKVLFGDSEAALEMLKHFEQDEVQLSDEIKTQFTEALNNLKIAKPKKK